MRAIVHDRYGGPEVLRLEEIDRPSIGSGEVLVRVRAASVNPADIAFLTGRPGMVRVAAGLRRPRHRVLGRDLAGVVEAVGPRVSDLAVGDEVYGEAGQAFAEFAAVAPARLWRKPTHLTFEQAATVPLAGLTAWQALDRAQVRPGQRVLVNGAAGGVGHFAVQIARAQGAEVTAVCSGRNAELVTGLGAEHVIDYQRMDFTTLGQQYDVILDAVMSHSIAETRRALAPTGTYLLVGTSPSTGPGEGGPLGPMADIARVARASVRARPQRLITVTAKANLGIAQLTALIDTGAVRPHIERTYPLADVPDALRHLATHHARGKLAIAV
jgi:NADPH:quinone reductase-like Zn-dependent oxidoreductase